MALGKIKVIQIPTDFFPRDEFQKVFNATSRCGDKRGGIVSVENTGRGSAP